jgi:hypothetical protein
MGELYEIVAFLEYKTLHKIGDGGKLVQFDESVFTKLESDAERVLPQQWVVSAIC